MKFIFYDTETTGLEPAFDQILQFAAIVTDDDFNPIEELNVRCRLQPHVVPSPGAMVTTGVGPRAIQQAPHSCYEMVHQIRTFIERWSPAVITGFNSIRYDEKMLRQAFYQHLHPVYLSNTRGNTRLDVMILAHAAAAWSPEVLNVSLNAKGNPSFKLVDLMAANNLAIGNAHDALADTRATIELARHIRQNAPDVWSDVFESRSKALVLDRLQRDKLVLFTDRSFKKPTIAAGVVCTALDNSSVHALFDLEYEPESYLNIDLEHAKKLLKASPRPIRLLRANNIPILRSWQDGVVEGLNRSTAEEKMITIEGHPTFRRVIGEALTGQYDDVEPSPHIEEQIFDGFPSKGDVALMEKFHRVPWQERYPLSRSFENPKYRQFGERLIFAEYPAGLPQETREELERWCRDRHFTPDECKWMTRAKAISELSAVKAAGCQAPELLADIEGFLNDR